MKQVTSDATETQDHGIPFALLFCCHWQKVYLSQSITYLFSFRTFLIAYDFYEEQHLFMTFLYYVFLLVRFLSTDSWSLNRATPEKADFPFVDTVKDFQTLLMC